MTTLPLTVLHYESPIGRAYLSMLAAHGYKADKIIQMVPSPGRFTRILPSSIRLKHAAAQQHLSAHHWPHVLPRQFPELCRVVMQKIADTHCLKRGVFDEIRENRPLENYADTVVRIECAGLKDPGLISLLNENKEQLILFTGGGLVPRTILELPGIRLLHIHPGFLPDVRGADGLLWSMLVRGKPGASGFIMKPGIDEGDLVLAGDFEPLVFERPENNAPDGLTLYRMIFSYYDPIIRAKMLERVLELFPDPDRITGVPQNLQQGRTYHFMNHRVRHLALTRIFANPASAL